MSLLAIIDGMKGLDCYAPCWVPSGTKKSFTKIHDLKGFFVPGDPCFFQRFPFIWNVADGFAKGALAHQLVPGLSAAFLLSGERSQNA